MGRRNSFVVNFPFKEVFIRSRQPGLSCYKLHVKCMVREQIQSSWRRDMRLMKPDELLSLGPDTLISIAGSLPVSATVDN